MINNTKEKIKLRMLKRIAQLWDIEQPEHLDPIVKLLTEAMSEEIFMLAGELDNIDDRLLSKLSAALTPVSYLTARPSHAIMKAFPVDAAYYLNSDTVFTYREPKTLRKYNVHYVDFSPVAPFMLLKARIRYLNICGRMYEYGDDFRKNNVAYPIHANTALNRALWIGIDAESEVTSPENLPLYFDFMNIKDKYSSLKLLSQARWSMNGVPVQAEYGIRTGDDPKTGMPYQDDTAGFIRSDIRALYDIHYITLRSASDVKMPLPEELKGIYEPETEALFTTPLFWIKIEFPAFVSKDVLEDIRVGMNMFPIANITKKRFSQPMTNVPLFLPLETAENEFFMEICSVSDSSGKVYEPVHAGNRSAENANSGYYALRKAGVERSSNTNDSFSTMTRLVNILRDHTLFTNTRTEIAFNQLIADANRSINRIGDALHEINGTPQVKSYLVVDKSNPGETLFVSYLTTNGAVINRFKPVSALESNLGAAIVDSQTAFVTPMRSGENDPTVENVRDKHRYMLTSKDRIITKQDIVNYCRAEYGEDIETIDIRPGYQVGRNPKSGMQKTIDIHLTLKPGSDKISEPENFKSDLLCKLESRSPDSFNYQIIVN